MLSGYTKIRTMDYVQSFEKGMIQDFADQPTGSFYHASAFHLVSKSGNTYALESAQGNLLKFSLTPNYIPIGGCGVLDKIVVFSARAGGQSEIGIVTVTQQTTCSYIPIYNDILDFSLQFPIESALFPENEKVERAYWTDRNTAPKVLNILDDRLYNAFVFPTGPLAIGSYMAVQGIVNFNGVLYGPQQGQTVFTVTATTPNTFSVIGAAPYKVIESIDKDMLEWTPATMLSTIRLNRPIAGGAKNGVYIATVQLVSEEGASTPWSIPCYPIKVSGPTQVGTALYNYQTHEGHPFTVNSSQGFELIIENIDQRYNRIRVAVVHGTDYQVYTDPVVIYDGTITGNTMLVQYTGTEMIEGLVEEDLLKLYKVLKKVGTFAIVNNIMFPGNIEYGRDVRWDPSVGVTSKVIKYDCFHDMENMTFTGHVFGHAPVQNPVNTSGSNVIRQGQWYRVKTGSVSYTGAVYNTGELFQGVSLNSSANAETYIPITGGTVEAVIRIKKYNDLFSDKYLIIPMESDFYDGKGMAVNHYLKSHWRGERYRYALTLVDRSGNVGYARWMNDKEIPEQYKSAGDLDDIGNPIGFDMRLYPLSTFGSSPNPQDPNPRYNIRHIGVEFNNIDFNGLLSELGLTSYAQLREHFSGFAIMRCPRDARIIAQGMVFPTVRLGSSPPAGYNEYMAPMAARKMFWDDNIARQAPGYYTFYSPDFQFQWNGLPALNQATNVMALGVYDYSGPDYFKSPVGFTWSNVDKNIAYYTQYGTYAPGGAVKNIYVDKCLEQVDFGASAGVGNSGFLFDNTAHSSTNIFTGAGSSFNGRGCRTTVIKIDPVEPTIQQYEVARSVINIRNSKTILYGGNGASAKATNQYISTNHFQPFDDEFITMLNNNTGVVSGIQVFGGDANIGLYDVMRVTRTTGYYEWNHAILFPVESNCNFLMRNGTHIAKTGSDNIYEQSPEQHSLSHAFSNDHLIAPYTALPDRYKPITRYPYRGLFSLKKIAGEEIDGFRKFDPAAFRDVSGLSGALTNFRAKGMRLFYWQKRSVGYIPVNERQSISSAVGDPTIIGQGGVMERYDERTNYYGNQHQFGLIDMPDGFAWIDVERKSLCLMNTNLEIVEMDVAKGMNSFLQERLKGNLFINDAPTNGQGIVGYYDPQYNRVVVTVMGTGNDFTFMYDQTIDGFTGFQPFKAGFYHMFQNMVFAMNPQFDYYTPVNGQQVPLGAVVNFAGTAYACIASYSYGGPVMPNDPIHWSPIFNSSEVYQQNAGDIAKWFGYVHPSEFQYWALGENLNEAKVWDNVEWRTSKEFFDTLQADTVDQSASDLLLTTNKNYQYRNKMWIGSLPLTTTGRLVDNKLKLSLTKSNRVNGSPVVSSNEKVVLHTAKTVYRLRY